MHQGPQRPEVKWRTEKEIFKVVRYVGDTEQRGTEGERDDRRDKIGRERERSAQGISSHRDNDKSETWKMGREGVEEYVVRGESVCIAEVSRGRNSR